MEQICKTGSIYIHLKVFDFITTLELFKVKRAGIKASVIKEAIEQLIFPKDTTTPRTAQTTSTMGGLSNLPFMKKLFTKNKEPGNEAIPPSSNNERYGGGPAKLNVIYE